MENTITVSNPLTSIDQLEPFDVVGFDADHTIVRYKVDKVIKLIIQCFVKTLKAHCTGYEEIDSIPDNPDFR